MQNIYIYIKVAFVNEDKQIHRDTIRMLHICPRNLSSLVASEFSEFLVHAFLQSTA